VPNGDVSGGYTTKQPKLSDLVIDHAGTRNIRSQLKKTKKIKITIHIDAVGSDFKRKMGGQMTLSYQHILTQLLKDDANKNAASRLDRIEKELKKLKRQIAA